MGSSVSFFESFALFVPFVVLLFWPKWFEFDAFRINLGLAIFDVCFWLRPCRAGPFVVHLFWSKRFEFYASGICLELDYFVICCVCLWLRHGRAGLDRGREPKQKWNKNTSYHICQFPRGNTRFSGAQG